MEPAYRQYDDLDCAIDEMRDLLDGWIDDYGTADPRQQQSLRFAQLILHEWLANLSQHARFPERTPRVWIRLEPHDAAIRCWIEDNSTGFDLEKHLDGQQEAPRVFPERGMGLQIIDACAEEYAYEATEEGRYRFMFSISPDHTPWLSTLF
jgi:serine/threonine-protein kinase RsbW